MSQLKEFLKVMSQLESNGGKNTNHDKLSDGTNAVGQYGIKPMTAKDMLKKSPDNVNDLDLQEVQQQLESSPEMQQRVAEILGQKILDKNKGQMTPSAVGWRDGQNKSLDANKDKLSIDTEYADKIEEVKQKLGIMPTLFNSMKSR
jgi:hypothetical protein